MIGIEFLLGFDVQIALKGGADRKDVTNLRTDAQHPRLEIADAVTRSAVGMSSRHETHCEGSGPNLLPPIGPGVGRPRKLGSSELCGVAHVSSNGRVGEEAARQLNG